VGYLREIMRRELIARGYRHDIVRAVMGDKRDD
jgi:hypothetical protein